MIMAVVLVTFVTAVFVGIMVKIVIRVLLLNMFAIRVYCYHCSD